MSAQKPATQEDVDHNWQNIGYSKFWNTLMHDIFGPRQGGAKILVDGENASLGIGKTSGAVGFARLLSRAFGYELKPDDFVLSANEYLERYRAHPGKEQPSVIVLDEMVGAGAGDKMRTMAKKNVNLVRAWQLQRVKRVVTITTLASWADAVKGLRKLADYRVLCNERPIGSFRPYKLGTFDFDESSRIKFERLDNRIYFPKMDDDPFYQAVSAKKDELIESEQYDADELLEEEDEQSVDEAERELKIQHAQRLRDQGMTTTQIADVVDMSQSWVSQNTSQNSGGETPA